MGGLTFGVEAGDCLHLWMRPLPGLSVATVTVRLADMASDLTVAGPTRNPLPVTWESPGSGEATLAWAADDADVSLAYAFTPATVAETGIRVLWTGAASRIDEARYRFHAGPPFGWMNDPNGLCEIDGVTHLFYQHNPHGRRWDTMHWGHALSRDGIDWIHQPLALLPPEHLVRGPDRQGGAFSGSALPRPDGSLRVFFTDRDDDRVPAREWQMTTLLAAGAAVDPPAAVLAAHPPLAGFRNDWRDPFVFEGPDGRLKMLLGGADATGSVVLLYESDDPDGTSGWRFIDVLFREPSRRAIPAECPCMIRLEADDLWVLIFGLIGSRDEATRRRNLTRAHIGHFDGRAFLPLHEHELDFGTDCYAMQVWQGTDGPRGIAWAANWTDVTADRDFETAMTLPRRLLWQDGRLSTPPIAAVETLRIGAPVDLAPGGRVQLDDGLAELALDLQPGHPFVISFDHPTHEMQLTYDGQILEFVFEPPGNRIVPGYRTALPDLSSIRVFIDVGLIEIYADDGRACCTKRFDSSVPVDALWLGEGAEVRSGKVWRLRSKAR